MGMWAKGLPRDRELNASLYLDNLRHLMPPTRPQFLKIEAPFCLWGDADSPYSLGRLHGRQLDRHHPLRVGLADQEGFGAEDVRCRHGGDTMLQPPGAVPAVRQEEGVLRLRLQPRD